MAPRFLGIDFGWQGKASGLAALEWNGQSLELLDLRLAFEAAEILAWVDSFAGPDAVAGVDAPLVIPNASGMRDADKLAHSRYGRYHAGCYPASRERNYWKRTTGLSESLLARGFKHGDRMPPRATGRYQIEVHPHAAIVQLNGLDRIVKYKRGVLSQRREGLERLRSLLLERLPLLTPSLVLPDLPPIPNQGLALKALEDQLDAITCAYVAAHWWFWGSQRNDVLGDAERGYIVVPQRRTAVGPLKEMRVNYTSGGLSESDLNPNPIAQFEHWFEQARLAGIREPNAMTLATVAGDGRPSARIVLLKGVSQRGFVFYTNYESRKGRELAAHPYAALVFSWPDLDRQVRITGRVSRISRKESQAYFHSRPLGSQLGAWASPQSSVIESREVLESQLAWLQQTYANKPVPLPPFWGGFRVQPDSIEFWQGRPDRLHDRLRYVRKGSRGWRIDRLSP